MTYQYIDDNWSNINVTNFYQQAKQRWGTLHINAHEKITEMFSVFF
jgi:hypothetical protein